jgi:formyl-CoA transferase
MSDAHYRGRQSVVEVDDPDLGSVWMANIVPRLSRTPGAIRHTGTTAVGGDRDEILHGLGDAPAEAATTRREEPDARG